MTKEEVLDQYDHTIAGMVLDSWAQALKGEAQVLYLRRIAPRAREIISRLYDEAQRIALEDQAKFSASSEPDKGLFGATGKKKKGKDDDGE